MGTTGKCGRCAWCENGMYCRKRHKDVGYFDEKPCFTTREEFDLLFAMEVTKKKDDNIIKQEKTMNEKMTNVATKVCKDCGRELPIEEFQIQVRSKDGRMHICKECKKKRMAVALGKEDVDNTAKVEKVEKLPETQDKYDRIVGLTDKDLVSELRLRGWEVTCTKVISL